MRTTLSPFSLRALIGLSLAVGSVCMALLLLGATQIAVCVLLATGFVVGLAIVGDELQ